MSSDERLGSIPQTPGGDRHRRTNELLMRVGEADVGALAALYDEFGPAVFSLARLRLRDLEKSAQVTHDVFLQIWHEACGFDPANGSAWAWIYARARASTSNDSPGSEDRESFATGPTLA